MSLSDFKDLLMPTIPLSWSTIFPLRAANQNRSVHAMRIPKGDLSQFEMVLLLFGQAAWLPRRSANDNTSPRRNPPRWRR